MKNKTAVEWLIEHLTIIQQEGLKDIIQQAKEMEKEQIISAYNQSWHDRMKPYKTADKYYNETFKSE